MMRSRKITSHIPVHLVWRYHREYPWRSSDDMSSSLRWRHNEHDCVSDHLRLDCLFNRLFKRMSKKSGTDGFPTQRANDAKYVSIWWRHQDDIGKNMHSMKYARCSPFSCACCYSSSPHHDVMTWKPFPRYWPFVRGTPCHAWFLSQMTHNADVWWFFDFGGSNLFNKHSTGGGSETPWRSCDITVMKYHAGYFTGKFVISTRSIPSRSKNCSHMSNIQSEGSNDLQWLSPNLPIIFVF